jgi:hypothetical protein
MPTVVENYIKEFEAGKNFKSPAVGLIVNKRIDSQAVNALRKEFATASREVRVDIANLFVNIGFQLSDLYPQEVVIQDSKIIEILVTEGFAKNDLAMSNIVDVLRVVCTEESLQKQNKKLAVELEKSPNDSLFLLIAKAKTIEANSTINRLIENPRWQKDQYVNIAQAALGDTEIENSYIKRARDASDANNGQALADALKLLGFIGTRRSLLTIASYLRTPVNVQRARFNRSVRLNALDALHYNFPAAIVLSSDMISYQKDYDAAEKFVTEKLGYVFEGPSPEFFTNQPFPVPMPPRQ